MEVTMAIKKRGWKCVNPECASSEFGEAVMNPDGSMDCKACGQRVERFEYFVDEGCQDCGASADLFCHCFCCGGEATPLCRACMADHVKTMRAEVEDNEWGDPLELVPWDEEPDANPGEVVRT